MSSKKYKIASAVILYNPGDEVVANVITCSNQTDIVYVIDNSELVNYNLKDKLSRIKKVSYKSLNENKGVAFALNLGVQLALKNHFDYLLTMDQDSKLSPGMVDKMIEACGSLENVGIISPLHRNKFKTQESYNSVYNEVLSIKTSGNLLNLDVYRITGPFKEEYFIDYVDIEYGMRLNLLGYKVLRVNSVILEHNEANLSERKFFGIKLYPWNHQPVRWYYKIRNLLYLEDEYRKCYPDFFKKEKLHYLRQFIKILLYEKDKVKKMKYALEGFIAYKKKLEGKIQG